MLEQFYHYGDRAEIADSLAVEVSSLQGLNRTDEAKSVSDEEEQMRKRIATGTAQPGQSGKVLVD